MSNNTKKIPSIDLKAFIHGALSTRKEIALVVDNICKEVGFLKITNHGIPKIIIDEAWSAAKNFFDLTSEEKNKYKPINSSSPRGYFPVQSETLTKSRGIITPPDLKEAFSCGPLNITKKKLNEFDFFYGENIWPINPINFKKAWKNYYHAMEKLSLEIMNLFAHALGLEESYFNKFYTFHTSALRALNYPPNQHAPLPNQQRAGAHTDYGSLTILLPDNTVGGLEVKHQDSNWIPINAEENTFIVNIGDMMARWTNDRWVSTMHRVITPNQNEGGISKRRQSIAYFQNPNFDAEISCLSTCLSDGLSPKYQSIKAGNYLMGRFQSAIEKRY